HLRTPGGDKGLPERFAVVPAGGVRGNGGSRYLRRGARIALGGEAGRPSGTSGRDGAAAEGGRVSGGALAPGFFRNQVGGFNGGRQVLLPGQPVRNPLPDLHGGAKSLVGQELPDAPAHSGAEQAGLPVGESAGGPKEVQH